MSNLIKTQNDIATSMLSKLRQQVTGVASNHNNIVLLDTSSSMDELVEGNRRRIDVLQDALQEIVSQRIGFRLFEFNNEVYEATPDQVFVPTGGTRLLIALQALHNLQPTNLTIITDGEPDNPNSCLVFAKQFTCNINVVFCGDPRNYIAINFCKSLAASGGGQFVANPLQAATIKLLPDTLRLMLTDGRPGSIAL